MLILDGHSGFNYMYNCIFKCENNVMNIICHALYHLLISVYNHPLWNYIDEAHMRKPQRCLCDTRRVRSVMASAQSDPSLHYPHEKSLGT